MNNEQVKAIELKGIAHNTTKTGTQDGQCEDLVNLRCKDGSWRTSGDGKQVYSMKDGGVYSQLFVHTNVYRHLLGVKGGRLYWFANIGADGATFSTLSSPMAICSVSGDLFITQTGHLLTIIDGSGSYVHALFSQPSGTYKVIDVDENGAVTSRKLYPFGEVHFNLEYTGKSNIYSKVNKEAGYIKMDSWGGGDYDINYNDSGAVVKDSTIWHADLLEMLNKATDANRFTMPFMAMVAVRLYDGSYLYASNPVLLYPVQKGNSTRFTRLLCVPEGVDDTQRAGTTGELIAERCHINIDTKEMIYGGRVIGPIDYVMEQGAMTAEHYSAKKTQLTTNVTAGDLL